MKLKIEIAKNAGFCFGVRRAYEITCLNAKNFSNLYILGKLVHNDDVCRELRRKGVKEISSIEDVDQGKLILTAHGSGPTLYKKAMRSGIKIIDATCPKVVKAQRLAKIESKKNYQIIILGDKQHKEVISINEWAGGKAIVIESLRDAQKKSFDKKKSYCLISQTTQNAKLFYDVKSYLSKKIPNFKSYNTICPATNDRQLEVREMAKINDAMVVIGGKDSANSKRLFEISRNINKKTFFVQNEKDLKKSWFAGVKKVGVAAGASTPKWVIEKVVEKLKSFDG